MSSIQRERERTPFFMIFSFLQSLFRELCPLERYVFKKLQGKCSPKVRFLVYVMMFDTTTESRLLLVDGCGRDDGCENFRPQKCMDSTNDEKTSISFYRRLVSVME